MNGVIFDQLGRIACKPNEVVFTYANWNSNNNVNGITITYGNGNYISGRSTTNGWNNPIVYSSTDLVNWTLRLQTTFGSTPLGWLPYASCYGNNTYAICGSSNGATVTHSTGMTDWSFTYPSWSDTNSWVNDICYGTKFVVVGQTTSTSKISYSTDCFSWTNSYSITGGTWLASICYGNGTYVVIGSNNDHTIKILTSGDGINWYDRGNGGITGTTFSAQAGAQAVTYGNNTFVSNWGVYIFYSSDGISWNRTSLPTANYAGLCEMKFNQSDGLFYLAALVNNSPSFDIKVFTSSNGITWNLETIAGLTDKAKSNQVVNEINTTVEPVFITTNGISNIYYKS